MRWQRVDRGLSETQLSSRAIAASGGGAGEAGGSAVARCAREVAQKSQSVLLLFREALDRWEHERCHLVVPGCEERGGGGGTNC